jgi:EF hand
LSGAAAARIVTGVQQLAKRSAMRLAQSLFFLVAAALALAVGASYAEDKIGRDKNDPGFNNLDKNKDGYISKSEAKGNPTLYKKFKEADKNGDGKLSRMEYLEAMTKQDANTAKNKIERAMDKNKTEGNASTGSSTGANTK